MPFTLNAITGKLDYYVGDSPTFAAVGLDGSLNSETGNYDILSIPNSAAINFASAGLGLMYLMGRVESTASFFVYADVGLDGEGVTWSPDIGLTADYANDLAIFDSYSLTASRLQNRAGPLQFLTNGWGAGNIRMTIDNSGNVDIADHNAATVGLKLGGTLITASAAELNYSDGVTGNIQTQLSLKAALAGPTFTGTVTVPSTNFTVGTQVLTQTNLTDLLDGGDTTLHDHDGISENTTARHVAITLNASATTGGLGLSTQEITFRAATNAQTGYATAAHISAIEANTNKVTCNFANVNAALAVANAAIDVNSQDLTTVGRIGCGGVAAPQSELDLNGRLRIDADGTAPTTGAGMEIYYNVANKAGVISSYNRDGSVQTDLKFYGLDIDFYPTNYATFSSCNVGIGTLTPDSSLHISGGSTTYRLHIQDSTNTKVKIVSGADANEYAQMLFGEGTSTGEYVEFLRYSEATAGANSGLFSIRNDGYDISMQSSGHSVDIASHDASTVGLKLGGTLVTASAAELNILDGVTVTTAELNYLDGETAQLILMKEVFS